jgi:protein-L-isoaspartate(D-aspartate) O-methyltransferase
MTELLISHTNSRGKIFDKVLEIGSGCGYQSAVLSFFSEKVDSIERIKPLVQKSRDNMSKLKINNVIFKFGDGYQDWDSTIKYDGILCAAAPREYPRDLVSILKNDARLVLPVGGASQKLNVIKKCENDEIEESFYDEVSFVPMLAGKSDDGNDV